jgi:hypothetical protein
MRQRSPAAVLQLRLWMLAVSVSPALLRVLAADLSKGVRSCSLLPASLRFGSPAEISQNVAYLAAKYLHLCGWYCIRSEIYDFPVNSCLYFASYLKVQ